MTLLQFIEREIESCGGIDATLDIIERERANYIYIPPKKPILTGDVFRAAHLLCPETKQPRIRKSRAKREPIPKVIAPKVEIWTDEKLAYLVKNYNRFSNLDLSIKLHISAFLIGKKMSDMGLKRAAAVRIAHTFRDERVLDNNYGGWF